MICPNCHNVTTSSNGYCQYCHSILPENTIRISENGMYYGVVSYVEYQEMRHHLMTASVREEKRSFCWGMLLGGVLTACVMLLLLIILLLI